MSWLSEIEEKISEDHELCIEDEQCMARVIREQSAYINASRAVEQSQAEPTSVEMIALINTRLEAEQNLSPDAKEVINENK